MNHAGFFKTLAVFTAFVFLLSLIDYKNLGSVGSSKVNKAHVMKF